MMTKQAQAIGQLAYIDAKIADENKTIESMMKQLVLSVEARQAIDIVTFIPGYIRRIEKAMAEISSLEEQKKLLKYFVIEEEGA